MLSPVFKKISNLIYYALFWLGVIIVHFFVSYYFSKENIVVALVDAFVYNSIFAIISLGLWYAAFYNPIEKKSYLNIIITHLVIAAASISLWITLGNFFSREIIYSITNYNINFKESITLRILTGNLFYFVTIFSYYLYIYYTNFQEKLTNESKLESLIKEAELKAIKSQINPHFLFNSLNSISSLTISNPNKAQEMIITLSEYLRYSISQKDQQTSSLIKEIDNCKKYLNIEKSRFNEKLEIEFNIDEKCNGFIVPTMILQPLYENAIKYGVYESTEIVKITTDIKNYGDIIEIVIKNNFDPDAIPRKGEGFGLKSISDRLKIIYGSENLFSIKKDENTFTAKIIIPKK